MRLLKFFLPDTTSLKDLGHSFLSEWLGKKPLSGELQLEIELAEMEHLTSTKKALQCGAAGFFFSFTHKLHTLGIQINHLWRLFRNKIHKHSAADMQEGAVVTLFIVLLGLLVFPSQSWKSKVYRDVRQRLQNNFWWWSGSLYIWSFLA